MAKFERYDARDDFFDGGELEDEEDEGSRLPLLLVIGLLFVAAFAGVVWLAYTQGVQRGRADAPRMLVAAGGPVKEAPASPGGTETPFKGLKIYQQPAPPEDEDTESSPQPPTPKAAAPAPQPAPVKAAPQPVKVAAAPAAQPSAEELPPDIQTLGPTETPAATKPPQALHPAAPPPALKPSTGTEATAKPVPPAKPPVKAAALEAPAVTTAAAGPALQIGAYKSEDEANAAWNAFAHKHPMVSSYQSSIAKVDLGDKGIWYRLRLGTFSDKSAAMAFCDKLKADGGNCFLAR